MAISRSQNKNDDFGLRDCAADSGRERLGFSSLNELVSDNLFSEEVIFPAFLGLRQNFCGCLLSSQGASVRTHVLHYKHYNLFRVQL